MGNDSFWNFYWDERLQFLQGQGKREVILRASQLIRETASPFRILEAGSGCGQVVGALAGAHGCTDCVGIDIDPKALLTAARDYPQVRFQHGDIRDQIFLKTLGKFDLLILVNTLHHVFSEGLSGVTTRERIRHGKQAVEACFKGMAGMLGPGGVMIIFDGLEPDNAVETMVEIGFRSPEARHNFLTFAREFQPWKIEFLPLTDMAVRLNLRDFSRYLSKLIFLAKPLWERERQESYQYMTKDEIQKMLAEYNFRLVEWHLLSVDYAHWLDAVEILTPGMEFPAEHVMLLAEKLI